MSKIDESMLMVETESTGSSYSDDYIRNVLKRLTN